MQIKDLLRHVHEARGTRRILDYLYGPMAKGERRTIVGLIAGVDPSRVALSDKRCQYGNLRQMLLDIAGITGTCKADEDNKFETHVSALFRSHVYTSHARTAADAAQEFCREYFTNNVREIESWKGNRFYLVNGVSSYDVLAVNGAWEIWKNG